MFPTWNIVISVTDPELFYFAMKTRDLSENNFYKKETILFFPTKNTGPKLVVSKKRLR